LNVFTLNEAEDKALCFDLLLLLDLFELEGAIEITKLNKINI